MPKLTKKVQKAAASAPIPGSDFPVWEPGIYTGRLAEVEARTSNAGNPVWNVTFDEVKSIDGEEMPGRIWYNLNLPIDEMPDSYREGEPEATREKKWGQYQSLTLGRLHGFFEAFGYTVDSDTDEMIGERCRIRVGQQTAQKGKKAGQEVNTVEDVMLLDGDDEDGEGGGEDDEF